MVCTETDALCHFHQHHLDCCSSMLPVVRSDHEIRSPAAGICSLLLIVQRSKEELGNTEKEKGKSKYFYASLRIWARV